MKYPRISIVTPSLNQGKYLESTICSILDQGYPDLEYIIIDGGSCDNSLEIIKKYEGHLSYWISENDRGQSDAINKGLIRVTGEYVSWINSDDMLHPNILFKIPSYFDQDNIGLIFGRSISFGENIIEKISDSNIIEVGAKTLGSMAFPQPASFFRKGILDKLGFLDESLHYGMDYDLIVRIGINYEIKPINEIISLNRYHSESKSISKAFNFALDWAKVFSKILRSFDSTDELIFDLKSLRLYQDGTDVYEATRDIKFHELKRAYIYFLQEQAQLYYSAYKLEQSKAIVNKIKELDKSFYERYKLGSIHFRSTYIPKSVLKLAKDLRSQINSGYQYGW